MNTENNCMIRMTRRSRGSLAHTSKNRSPTANLMWNGGAWPSCRTMACLNTKNAVMSAGARPGHSARGSPAAANTTANVTAMAAAARAVTFAVVFAAAGDPRALWPGLAPALITAFFVFKHAMVRQDGHAPPFHIKFAVGLLFLLVCAKLPRDRR